MGQTLGKYHITEDGNIYRINDDSSFTYLGNVENIANLNPPKNGANSRPRSRPTPPKKPNSTKWIVLGVLLYIIAIVGCILTLSVY